MLGLESVGTLGRDWNAAGQYGRKLVSRVDPQLAEDAREVTLDRACGHEEGLGDLAVSESLAGELGDAALAGCQRVEPRENDPAWAGARGAELGLGIFGEGPGACVVGGVECLTEELSCFGAAVAPPQHRAEVSEGTRPLQPSVAALEGVDGLTEQGCSTVTSGHDAGRTKRHAECAGRAERAGEPKFVFCQASRRFLIAERKMDEGSL